MRYCLIVLVLTSSLQAMESKEQEETWISRVSLSSVVSIKDDVKDACATFLKRFQTTPPSSPPSSPEQEPLRIELADSRSRSSSPFAVGEAIVGRRIPDSPPKSPLQEDAILGDRIPERPTIFRITNYTDHSVLIHVIFSDRYKSKKYIFGPMHSMTMLSPDAFNVQFQEVHLPHYATYVKQDEDAFGAKKEVEVVLNEHLARYVFQDVLFARLAIVKDQLRKNQLKIIKKGIL